MIHVDDEVESMFPTDELLSDARQDYQRTSLRAAARADTAHYCCTRMDDPILHAVSQTGWTLRNSTLFSGPIDAPILHFCGLMEDPILDAFCERMDDPKLHAISARMSS